MTEDRWEEIKKMAHGFKIIEEKTKPITIKTGLTSDTEKEIGQKEIIVFQGPAGKIKLEYSIKPMVIDKKEHYTHRAGASAQTEYILSDSEFVRHLKAFRWDDRYNEWQAMDANTFN